MEIRSFAPRLLVVSLVVAMTAGAAWGHEIVGVQSYYACQANLARAFLRSPNPGAGNVDYPLVVVDADGNPTGEYIMVMSMQNVSSFDARVTSVGFDFPGEFDGYELVQLHHSYNELTTNVGGVRTGTAGPEDYTAVQSASVSQPQGDVQFSIREAIHGVPGFPHTELDVALVTGKRFAGGQPSEGLAPDAIRHVVALKGFLPVDMGTGSVLEIEGLLNYSYVRFRQVGPNGDGDETGIWRNLLPAISCP
jgi:hypothetical protein